MLHTLVILPCDTEADHTLGLRKPLENFNEFGALLDSWLEGQKDLLDSLFTCFETSVNSSTGLAADTCGHATSCFCFMYLEKLFLVRIALDDALEQFLQQQPQSLDVVRSEHK